MLQILNQGLIDPLNPKVEDIDLETISVVLERVPRFGGHTTKEWSLKDHSIYCMLLAMENGHRERDLLLSCLFHDVHEIYTGFGDVASPVKHSIPGLHQIEGDWDLAVSQKFDFTWSGHPYYDLLALASEKHYLMQPCTWPRPLPPPNTKGGLIEDARTFPFKNAYKLAISFSRR